MQRGEESKTMVGVRFNWEEKVELRYCRVMSRVWVGQEEGACQVERQGGGV